MALQHKKAQGERVSRHVPYGSRLAADGTHLEADQTEQAVIVIARTLHTSGVSSRKIAARLAARGMYSRVGTIFTPSAILAMVAAG